MTRDDINRLAREAGYLPDMFGVGIWDSNEFNRFAALVAAAEREQCAKVCEEDLRDGYIREDRPIQEEVMLLAAIADCAAAIRARGEDK